MTRRAAVVFLIVSGFLFLSRSWAASDPIEDWEISEIGKGFGQNLSNLVQSAVDLRQAWSEENAEIEKARRQFWDEYPDGPGFAEAQAHFNGALASKDMSYLMDDIYDEKTLIALRFVRGGDLDGGIPKSAQEYFEEWTAAVKRKLKEGGPMNSLFELPVRLTAGINGSMDQYAIYKIARDFAEFDSTNVKIPLRQNMSMLIQRNPRVKTAQEAIADYKVMQSVYGEDRMLQTLEKLLALTNGKQTEVKDLQRFNQIFPKGLAPDHHRDVYWVWLHLLGSDDRRAFLITELVYEVFLGHGGPNPAKSQWQQAVDLYDRLLLAYGQQRVFDVIDQIRSAARSQYDGSLTSGFSGVNDRTAGGAAVESLHRSSAEGYLRFLSIENAGLTTRESADARVAALYSRYTKEKVLAVVEQVRDAKLGNRTLSGFGTGTNDPYTAIVTSLEPRPAENPAYIFWANWKPGAKATYRKVKGPWNHEITFELLDINQRRAMVRRSYEDISFNGRPIPEKLRNRTEETQEFGAWGSTPNQMRWLLHPTEGYLTFDDGAAPVDESLTIADREFHCQTRTGLRQDIGHPRVDTKVWMSKDVPGGLVRVSTKRDVTDSSDPLEIETTLVSFETLDLTRPSLYAVSTPQPENASMQKDQKNSPQVATTMPSPSSSPSPMPTPVSTSIPESKPVVKYDPEYDSWSKFAAGTSISFVTSTTYKVGGGTRINQTSSKRVYHIDSVDGQWVEISCVETTLDAGKESSRRSPIKMGVGIDYRMGSSVYVSRRRAPWMSCITGQPYRLITLPVVKSGRETLTIAGHPCDCQWYTTEKQSGDPASLNATFWLCDDVPGRFVRMVSQEQDRTLGVPAVYETTIESLNIVKSGVSFERRTQ